MGLRLTPIDLREANRWVLAVHRHHQPHQGHKFSIGVEYDGQFCGAVIVGRPVARNTNRYEVIEVVRLATDGTPNACTILYAAAARAAAAMGYKRIQTFLLLDEPGTSLKAAGWEFDGITEGGDWNRPSRGGRRIDQPMGPKQRWKKEL